MNETNGAQSAAVSPAPRPTPSNAASASFASIPNRPESRGTIQPPLGSRPLPSIPNRNENHGFRGRQFEQPKERSTDYPAANPRQNNRPDLRTSGSVEFGRPERPLENLRERGSSPGRRRSRSPHRGAVPPERHAWPARDTREYQEPWRSGAYGDNPRNTKETHDQRDFRERDPLRDQAKERHDHRGPPNMPPTTVDNRNRMHTGQVLPPNDGPSHRKDLPRNVPYGERGGNSTRPNSNVKVMGNELPSITTDRSGQIDPGRAAWINSTERGAATNDDRPRYEASARLDREAWKDERENRRERGPGAQVPRYDERPVGSYHNVDGRREYNEERHANHPNNHDRRDELSSHAMGPRNGRDGGLSARVSRESFLMLQGPRTNMHPSQDPNYGRLNQPSDNVPAGPRRRWPT